MVAHLDASDRLLLASDAMIRRDAMIRHDAVIRHLLDDATQQSLTGVRPLVYS
jgi:hypothetical protein